MFFTTTEKVKEDKCGESISLLYPSEENQDSLFFNGIVSRTVDISALLMRRNSF